MLFGVIALPALVPIAALLQLLFPGILREQWKRYQYVVKVLVSQSTILFIHYGLSQWVFRDQPWWLGDKYLWGALVAVSAIGMLISFCHRDRSEPSEKPSEANAPPPAGGKSPAPVAEKGTSETGRPTSLEYWALGVLAVAGLAWMAWQFAHGEQPWDPMAIVTLGAVAGVLHLLWRTLTHSPGRPPTFLTTERIVLMTLVMVGIGLTVYVNRSDANQAAGNVSGEWLTFHYNAERTGATQANDPGIKQPRLLWSFAPAVRKGRVILDASPTIVDGQFYVGGLHQVSTSLTGNFYCVNAADGRVIDGKKVAPGERLATFTADDALRPVISSPAISGGRIYFGEGFHEDKKCRLYCVDAGRIDRVFWSKETTSHVESSPTIVGNRIYFGAGDDGVYCLELPTTPPKGSATPAEEKTRPENPKTLWHLEKLHVDSSPAVVGNRVFVGSILGDIYTEFKAIAIDAEKGDVLWSVPAKIPVVACPAATKDHVFFGLGKGKLNVDDDHPEGAVWCLDAATGNKKWERHLDNAVFASPIPSGDVVYAVCRDAFCYCLNNADGSIKWKKYLNAPLLATPVLASGKLYVVSANGVIYCLNAADGEILWTFDQLKTDEPDVFSSPALVHGKLYVAIDGKVHCLGD